MVLTGEPPRADAEATARCRDALRAERLEAARTPRRPMEEGPVERDRHRCAARDVELREAEDGTRRLTCAACAAALADASGSYRDGSAVLELPLPALDPRIFQDPSTQVDVDGLVVRQYLCPGCAVALDTVVCPRGQEPEWDVLLEGAEEER